MTRSRESFTSFDNFSHWSDCRSHVVSYSDIKSCKSSIRCLKKSVKLRTMLNSGSDHVDKYIKYVTLCNFTRAYLQMYTLLWGTSDTSRSSRVWCWWFRSDQETWFWARLDLKFCCFSLSLKSAEKCCQTGRMSSRSQNRSAGFLGHSVNQSCDLIGCSPPPPPPRSLWLAGGLLTCCRLMMSWRVDDTLWTKTQNR